MNCTHVCSTLVRYLDNDLPAETAREVEEHLDHCFLCQEELHAAVAVQDMCEEALRHPSPRNRFAELRPLLADRSLVVYRRHDYLRKLTSGLAVAAGLIMLLSVAEPLASGLQRLFDFNAEPCLNTAVAEPQQTQPFPGVYDYRLALLKAQRETLDRDVATESAAVSEEPPANDPNGPISKHMKRHIRLLA
jgi:hypothetical protein